MILQAQLDLYPFVCVHEKWIALLLVDLIDELCKVDIANGETLDIVSGKGDLDAVVDLSEGNRARLVDELDG